MENLLPLENSKKLIEELSNADGLAGFEKDVAGIFKRELSPFVDVKTDYMGNILGEKEGKSPCPRIMLCSHMDEVGLLVHSIQDDGKIKYIVHGSWKQSIMLQKPVLIRTEKGHIPGIISSTSSFFLSNEELKKFETKESMFIDVGASSKKEAMEFGIRPGNPVVFDSKFRGLANPGVFIGKAFDNRLGMAAVIEITKALHSKSHPNTIIPVATVQEEVGCRGAKAATTFCKPDIAIIIEGPPSDDVPLTGQSQCVAGKGPHIRRLENGMISNPVIYNSLLKTAEEHNIPCQPAICDVGLGGTDGSIIHKEALGIPSIMLGIPVRYAHAHHSLFFMEDYRNLVKLLVELLSKFDKELYEECINNPWG